jgi:hypothetical protein
MVGQALLVVKRRWIRDLISAIWSCWTRTTAIESAEVDWGSSQTAIKKRHFLRHMRVILRLLLHSGFPLLGGALVRICGAECGAERQKINLHRDFMWLSLDSESLPLRHFAALPYADVPAFLVNLRRPVRQEASARSRDSDRHALRGDQGCQEDELTVWSVPAARVWRLFPKIRAASATFRSSAQKRPQLWLFEVVVGQIFDFNLKPGNPPTAIG